MADTTVFTAIENLPRPQLTEAVYQILLILRHRNYLQKDDIGAMLDAASFESPIDPKGRLRKKIDASLRAIEAQERKPLKDISAASLSKYQRMLSNMLSDRVEAHLADLNISGVELLKQLN